MYDLFLLVMVSEVNFLHLLAKKCIDFEVFCGRFTFLYLSLKPTLNSSYLGEDGLILLE